MALKCTAMVFGLNKVFFFVCTPKYQDSHTVGVVYVLVLSAGHLTSHLKKGLLTPSTKLAPKIAQNHK